MPTDAAKPGLEFEAAFDVGLLSPVTAGHGAELNDAAIAGALAAAEVALTRAWAAVGVAPRGVAAGVSDALGWQGTGQLCAAPDLPLAGLVSGAIAGGNPVIPLVGALRDRVPADAKAWVHRGATSQDIMDSALMLAARGAAALLHTDLRTVADHLGTFAREHRVEIAVARTLTQHAVPTTLGARAAGWTAGVARAAEKLDAAAAQLPAQLAGAGGTLAAFVEIGGVDAATRLPEAFAAELGLCTPDAPWHTVRWPITELGDALTQAIDALGVVAADVATLSRNEIGELAEGSGGGSSAMPQKQNPARSVLIRSAALRAPFLSATLHAAASAAVDERPDGAWHAEWPTLRELLRLARGAAANAVTLVNGLRVDSGAVARNLALTGDAIVTERLVIVLTPIIGAGRTQEILAAVGRGESIVELLRADPALAALERADGERSEAEPATDRFTIEALLDPANYTGLARQIADPGQVGFAGASRARFAPAADDPEHPHTSQEQP